MTKSEFFTKSFLGILPKVTEYYLLTHELSEDDDRRFGQVNDLTNFAGDIAFSAAYEYKLWFEHFEEEDEKESVTQQN